MTPEGKVKKWFSDEVKKRWPSAKRIRWPAGQYGSKGVADDILCIHGYFIAVEAKADSTCSATPMQKDFGKEVLAAGGFWDVLLGKDEKIFDKISKHIQFMQGNKL